MKKNLLYLLALVCSLTFFAACSSDDDDSDNKNNGNPPEEEAAITAPDVVGTYWGNLDISMIPDGSDQEIVIGDGIEKFITLSQVSNTEVKIELKEFELFINQQILKFGDIVVDKCEVKKGEGVSTFTGQQDLTFEGNAAALGTCPVTVTGTVEDSGRNFSVHHKRLSEYDGIHPTGSHLKGLAAKVYHTHQPIPQLLFLFSDRLAQ